MHDIIFECRQCGVCCRNLLEEREGVVKGLTITAGERSLFLDSVVSPLTAVGKRGPQYIINYQLNVSDCPLIDEHNKCSVYEKRPLVCRAFPFVQTGFSVKCPVLKKLFKKPGLHIEFPIPDAEFEADQKREQNFQNRLEKHIKRNSKIWVFDLAEKQWKAIAQTT